MLSSTSEYTYIAEWNDPPQVAAPDQAMYQRRALSIWPGLDRTRLRRTHGDPWRIARLVAGGTSLSVETILVLLMGAEGHARVEMAARVRPSPLMP
jgi:hypothetical protein